MTSILTTTLNLLLVIATLFSITVSPIALAQNEGKWYKVEMIVFKRQGSEASASEYIRSNINLAYPEYSRYLNTQGSGNLQLSSPKQHKLGGYNYTLRKNENFRVLFHKQWTQKMQRKNKSPAIIISGGESTGSHSELEGYIKLHVGRYLHIDTNLWLSEFDFTSSEFSRFPKLPSRPNQNTNESNPFSKSSRPSKVSVFNQKRRMRSNELHYIDHPLMGLLIQITPLSG